MVRGVSGVWVHWRDSNTLDLSSLRWEILRREHLECGVELGLLLLMMRGRVLKGRGMLLGSGEQLLLLLVLWRELLLVWLVWEVV